MQRRALAHRAPAAARARRRALLAVRRVPRLAGARGRAVPRRHLGLPRALGARTRRAAPRRDDGRRVPSPSRPQAVRIPATAELALTPLGRDVLAGDGRPRRAARDRPLRRRHARDARRRLALGRRAPRCSSRPPEPAHTIGTEPYPTRHTSTGSLSCMPSFTVSVAQRRVLAALVLALVVVVLVRPPPARRWQRRPRSRSRRSGRRRRVVANRPARSSSTSSARCADPGSITSRQRLPASQTRSRRPAGSRGGPTGAPSTSRAPVADGQQVVVAARGSPRRRRRGVGSPAAPVGAPVSLSAATRRAARHAAGDRPGDGAEDRRVPAGARAVHLRRGARRDPGHRPGAARASCKGWSSREAACSRRSSWLGAAVAGSRRPRLARPARAGARRAGALALVRRAWLVPPRAGALAGRRAVVVAARLGVGQARGSTRSTAARSAPAVGRAGRVLVVVTGEPRVGRFDAARARARARGSKGASSASASSSSCRSAARRRRARFSACSRSSSAPRGPAARLRRAHLAAPAGRPRRPARRRVARSSAGAAASAAPPTACAPGCAARPRPA